MADTSNRRVLVFNTSSITNGMNASYVLGEADFTHSIHATTQSGLGGPIGLAYDSADTLLYVTDNPDNRVLAFNVAPGSIANGENASYVLGQSGFTTSTAATTQSGLSLPASVAYDAADTLLYVSDYGNNRVLVFNTNTASITNGENASYVLGQANFTSSGGATTQSGLNNPYGLFYDSVNARLFVPDSARVLVFNTSNLTNGENASYVLGQADFTHNTVATTQSGLAAANWATFDSANNLLYVSDYGNNRVLMFNTATSVTASGAPFYLGAGQAFVSRASTATYFNSSGTLSTGASNTARTNYTYNGTSWVSAGTLIEPASTNLISRSEVTGAVTGIIGSGGSMPTGWSIVSQQTGLVISVSGSGTETNGMTYVELTFSGTPTGTGYDDIQFPPLATTSGLSYTQSLYTKQVSGTDNSEILCLFSTGTCNPLGFLTSTSTLQRFSASATSAYTGTVYPRYGVQFATGTPASLVLRLYAPQVEQSSFATSYIPTSGTTITRSADVYSSIVNGENASDGLGQFDIDNATVLYTKSGANNGPNQLGFNSSDAVAMDPLNHYLFVADYYNYRVLVYALNTDNSINSRTPSYVLGAANFVSGGYGTTQSNLRGPTGLAADPVNQRLFVADPNNNRVLVFSTSSISNGMNASYVLGQSGFTTGTAATTQAGLTTPTCLAYDSADGLLYVGDTGDNRVMVFNVAPGSIANGENASYVLGQSGFTTGTAATTQSGLSTPQGLAYDPANARLFVADSSNERAMVFNVAPATISNGENASYELGQPSGANAFTTSGAATTQSGFNNLWGVAYDSANSRLFTVEATYGSRVKVFNVAPATISNGENASYVVGQSSFTAGSAATTQSGLNIPRNVMYDPGSEHLFVGDWGNNRVMIFEGGASLLNTPGYD